MTHPVQYYAPWFRHIAQHCPEIDLTVLYASQPTPEQQGVGFGQAFSWDVPLTEGYRCQVVRSARPEDNVHSGSFWGLDVPQIGTALLATNPDVVMIAGWYSVTLLRALRVCRRERIPVLYRGDSNLNNAPAGWRRPLWALKTRLLLRQFSAHLSVGQRARTYLRHFGVNADRIFASPHCVDNAFFASAASRFQVEPGWQEVRRLFEADPAEFVILFVGKLESKKRISDAIRAVARLDGRIRLLVIGTGPEEAALKTLARQHGVEVTWAGFLNQSDLGKAYAAADCLVLPSDAGETWGLVVNEAMATGLPCVVSDRVGCAPDLVVAGQTGEVFPMGDLAALAAALESVRRQRKAGFDFATVCRTRAEKYSFAAATTGLLAATQAVANGRRRRGRQENHSPCIIACCGGMVLFGGLERMVFQTLQVARECGSAVHCIVNDWENFRIVEAAERIGATWSTEPSGQRLDRHTRNPVHLWRMGWNVVRTSAGLLNETRRLRPDFIVIPELATVIRNGLTLAMLRAGAVHTILCMQNAPPPGSFYRRVFRQVVHPLVDLFVCCSEHVQSELIKHGVPAEKTLRIYNIAPSYNGASVSPVERDRGKIIYVGQVIPEKGLDLLLEALQILSRSDHDVRLDVVGQVEGWLSPKYIGYREALFERAQKPELVGRVRFLGWRNDVPALMTAAAIHCAPSRESMLEGLPLVNLEAKEAGIPSVVFPIGPFPELVTHQEDGWICSEVSPQALASGLAYFLDDPERAERAGRAARASAERFSRDRFVEQWLSVFERSPEGMPRMHQRMHHTTGA
jgi:glycosyltransferase involved in cell wall biosynthesis